MIFEWTISLGNLLTVIAFFVSAITFVMFMRADIMVLSTRVTSLEAALRELVQANLAMAEQRGKLEQLDQRMNLLSDRVDSVIFNRRTT